MYVLISLILTLIFIKIFRKALLKHENIFYILFTVIGIISLIPFLLDFKKWIASIYSPLIFILCGSLSGAMFIFVMYMGVINNRKIKKQFLPLRRQLSIIACILAYIQNIYFGRKYFVKLFTAQHIGTAALIASLISLLMIFIMTILFITSFKSVRAKIGIKKWKKVQKLAYIFYALLYFHIIVLILFRPKMEAYSLINVFIYTVIWFVYAYKKLGSNKYKVILRSIACILLIGISLFAINNFKETQDKIKAMESRKAIEFIDANLDKIEDKLTEFSNNINDKNSIESKDKIDSKETGDSEHSFKLEKSKDGVYQGSAMGYNEDIIVSITIKEKNIVDFSFISIEDDKEYYELEIDWFTNQIIEKNNQDIEAISEATTTCDAIVEAVDDAIEKSKAE